MQQSEGYDKLYKLNKGLYSLKQALLCWNEKFVDFLKISYITGVKKLAAGTEHDEIQKFMCSLKQ